MIKIKVQLALSFGPAFVEEIAELTDCSVKQVLNALYRLRKEGKVGKGEDGRWFLKCG